jgi:cutinase
MLLKLLMVAWLTIAVAALPASRPGLEARDNFSVVRNELSGSCKTVTIIFARGTTELGNVGTFAGPPFFNAVGDILGDSNIAVQGVDYGATIAGYLVGGDPAGASKLAALTNEAVSKCPSTQIVLSGYRYVFTGSSERC